GHGLLGDILRRSHFARHASSCTAARRRNARCRPARGRGKTSETRVYGSQLAWIYDDRLASSSCIANARTHPYAPNTRTRARARTRARRPIHAPSHHAGATPPRAFQAAWMYDVPSHEPEAEAQHLQLAHHRA